MSADRLRGADASAAALEAQGLPARDAWSLPTSEGRFPDGHRFRVEIPSVEGPAAFEAVLAAADEYGVRVDRISQGSGIMLQTDAEIRRMVELGREHDVEVCLFVGPRAGWDIGGQARSPAGAAVAASLRGADQLAYGVEDVVHGCSLGLRSVLVADIGLLAVLGRMKTNGDLPTELILKTSVSLPCTNPATARLLEDLGASTINVATDLSLAQVAAVRAAVSAPLDLYVEGPDDLGGAVRHYEIPEIVRVAAPVHLKFTVRNSPGLYPAGAQIEALVLSSARERVRRAAIGLAILRRHFPEAFAAG